MANYSAIKNVINTKITTNGNQEITGAILNAVLRDMVDALGDGFRLAGVASPTGSPASTDNRVAYIAVLAGTYTNYGGAVLDGQTVHLLTYDSTWSDIDTGITVAAYLEATFAKKDGYYASLTAGAAENLVGRGSVPASFLRRTTGGSADVGTGSAKIAKLMGNSIVWNQLLNPPANSAAVATNADTQVAYDSDTKICTLTGNGSVQFGPSGLGSDQSGKKWISGHKYYMAFRMSKTNAAIVVKIARSVAAAPILDVPVDSFAKAAAIVTAEFTTGGYAVINVSGLGENDNVQLVNNKMICVDLTKMFGAGKEPSTVAEFEALYPLDYYAYNNGEVIPFAAQKLVTTGFNQYNPETGKALLIGGKEYQITGTYTAATIDGVAVTLDAEDCFTPDADCELVITGGNETDTCVHLVWSGYRNGEYEPFELHEAIFDPANWEDANGDKIFPYGGMHGVGTARDFATPDNDGYIRKGTRVWDRRAYAAGDESDSSVITDGSTYTFVKLAEPVEKELAEPVAASYYANDFGTEEWTPANDDEPYTAPCEMHIAYAMNSVDTLRNLNRNYLSKTSTEHLLAALVDAGILASYTMTYDEEEAAYDFTLVKATEENA